jgi:hypothetical protein
MAKTARPSRDPTGYSAPPGAHLLIAGKAGWEACATSGKLSEPATIRECGAPPDLRQAMIVWGNWDI